MPHYFIDLHDGERITPDDDGAAYDGAEAARREAIRALTLLASDTLPDGRNREFTVKIWNETGEPVYEALLSFRGTWIGGPGGA
ncbi:hypothetical protein Q8W71_22015 [Methylobacterium sp. NEAU 140]|uniref:DUF6894 family protein n=1 Tax=Methylobacterium sp. NEAU 140 TaxID=3064945 RepID=UPI002732351F|nr:hypothetical protein [Methylobacterium sp. NEAU 140]MDP4025311.1 hypothetical protein [Methylobacterium sp. NEAU 140]